MSPTARTLALLRSQGFLAQVVEQTVPHTYIKRDLFGFIDVIAVTATSIIGCQVTTGDNLAARLDKIRGECRDKALAWLRAGGKIHVYGWRKVGGKGMRKLWAPRVVGVLENDGELVVPGEEIRESSARP